MTKNPDAASFKKLSRAMIIALAVVAAMASFPITMPAGKTAAANWKFTFTHPTILLHIIVAAVILAAAGIGLLRTVRAGDRFWIALSAGGLFFVLLAFIGGLDYVATLSKSALGYMNVGWVGAVIAYGTGWYLGRRMEREKNSLQSAS